MHRAVISACFYVFCFCTDVVMTSREGKEINESHFRRGALYAVSVACDYSRTRARSMRQLTNRLFAHSNRLRFLLSSVSGTRK